VEEEKAIPEKASGGRKSCPGKNYKAKYPLKGSPKS
jgi:hypothetical protein